MNLNVQSMMMISLTMIGLSALAGLFPNMEAFADPTWSERAAAKYLDGREAEWQAWDRPHKDRATLCISCHTQTTYGLARPVLHRAIGDQKQSAAEQAMLASIRKRVTEWSLMQPFYSDIPSGPGKEVESHNSEAVLNAIILSSYDQNRGHLSDESKKAFENAWALQSMDGPDAGSWVWQNFGLEPFESKGSQYHFAALLAVAVGHAPDNYRADPRISKNLAVLIGYLRTHYEAQSLLNKIVALWASQSFPAILEASQQSQLLQEIYKLQHADGGWSLPELGPWPKRKDDSSFDTRSDGYATALTVLVQEQAGATSIDQHVARGLKWLMDNQDKATGAWRTVSLNKSRDPASMPGKFMSDTATAYAILALEQAKR